MTGLQLDDLTIIPPGSPDFGSARIRAPADTWAQAGIPYHTAVLVSFSTTAGEWTCACVTALGAPSLDIRAVLVPPGASLSDLECGPSPHSAKVTLPATQVTAAAACLVRQAAGSTRRAVFTHRNASIPDVFQAGLLDLPCIPCAVAAGAGALRPDQPPGNQRSAAPSSAA